MHGVLFGDYTQTHTDTDTDTHTHTHTFKTHLITLQREAIEIHKHQHSFNKKEESLKLNKAWLPALENTACNRSTNSTQPQGPGIIAQKRPDKDIHQPQ